MRLTAPLRLETKQEELNDAIADFEGGGFAPEQFRVENIAACKRTCILGIRSKYAAAKSGLRLKSGAALKHDVGFGGRTSEHWPERITRGRFKYGARAIEGISGKTCELVLDR